MTIAHSPFGPLLLAANFHHRRVDVFNSRFQRLAVGRLFRDPNLPAGYAPFNVAVIGGRVLVSYAQQDADREDDVAGRGHGFVDAYTTYGTFAAPGRQPRRPELAVGPGARARRTSASSRTTCSSATSATAASTATTRAAVVERGTLRAPDGHAIRIDGLWGLLVGDTVAGGPNAVWFSAGPDGESHGLLGTFTAG